MPDEAPRFYHVTVTDKRVARYCVRADSAEQAREAVEASSDADADFGYVLLDDTSWSVDSVEDAGPAVEAT